jgi:hypothetical protein
LATACLRICASESLKWADPSGLDPSDCEHGSEACSLWNQHYLVIDSASEDNLTCADLWNLCASTKSSYFKNLRRKYSKVKVHQIQETCRYVYQDCINHVNTKGYVSFDFNEVERRTRQQNRGWSFGIILPPAPGSGGLLPSEFNDRTLPKEGVRWSCS